MMFSADQHRFLLELAREAIYRAIAHGEIISPVVLDEALRDSRGAFVTLTDTGELRGCIGFTEPVFPLYETIVRSGIAAAVHDPRFPPVVLSELDRLSIEISVLSPLLQSTPEAVEVGTHGLVVERGHARGLLLPQVPVEWGWTRDEFLAHTCRKAGLPADAWRQDATLYTFTAEVFGEQDYPPAADRLVEGDE